MFRGLNAFKREMKDFSHDVPRGGLKAIKKVSREWFVEVVNISPVYTGFFSSKWKWQRNHRPGTSLIKHPSPGHGQWGGARTPAFTTLRADDTLYIYNNVEYGARLEHGYSKKAPANFFNNSARRANRRLRNEFKRLKWKDGKLTR